MPTQSRHIFFNQLTERLKRPLPGSKVQNEMSASPRGKTGINFNFDEDPRESSVLITLFEREGEILFPLIQRPQYTGIHSGQIGLPGGKVEDQDKDREETALRETEEEIGIDAKDIQILGRLSELYVQASHYNVLPVVGYVPYIPVYNPDPEEVSRVIEGRISELVMDEKRKVKELLIRDKYHVIAPYFDLNHEMVWGATAMILSEFSFILKELMN